MIDWVHFLLRDWGRYIRHSPSAWPSENHIAHIGRGGGNPQFGPNNPEWHIDPDIAQIHQMIRSMPEYLRNLLYVFYVRRCSPKDKAKALGISVSRMYEYRSHAHFYIAGSLESKELKKIPEFVNW